MEGVDIAVSPFWRKLQPIGIVLGRLPRRPRDAQMRAALTMSQSQVSITFTPTVLGKQTGTLSFIDNASNSPQTVPLSGIGVEPATLTPASATYGQQSPR
jgi:hypothetical protein